MKRLFILLVVVAFGVFLASEFGFINLPGISSKVVETAQRAFGRGRRGAQAPDEIPVLTALVLRQDVPVTLDAVGTVQAVSTVLVRAQVEGMLTEVNFRDGQEVKKGDVLARIDARSYQALYDQAMAKKAQDTAQLANARIDLERYDRLAVSNFGSKQQADTQRALVAQLEALLKVDQAQIDSQRTVLDYTTIIAPVDGRTGLRAVDAGNIIRSSDANGLVTITQMQPIAAVFNMPQQQLRALNDSTARGPVRVDALDADNTTIIDQGVVDVIDNQVDITTGTVRVKAAFPNAQRHLWPGQFVNIRVFVDVDRQALVIPSSALQRGPSGPYVYVVSADNLASLRTVTVRRQDEKNAVLASGVEAGQRVVATGFTQLTDGARVKPDDSEATRPAAATNAAPVAPAAPGTTRRGPPGDRRRGQGDARQGPGAAPDGGTLAAPSPTAASGTEPRAGAATR